MAGISLQNQSKSLHFSRRPTAKPYLPPGVPGRCWLRSERRIRDSAPRSHVELVALLATKGRMRYLIDDRILTLGPGALLWAHTDQAHVLLAETRDFDMWVLVAAPWVLRPARLFPPRRAREAGPAEARVLDTAAVAELEQIAAGLRGATDSSFAAIGLKWWVARAWRAWQEAPGGAARRRVHPAVVRAAEILRGDPALGLAQVASRAGLSLSQLGRLFGAELGLGLAKFRTARRLDRVDAIVAGSPRTKLLAAALDAGFGSYAQFYRAFAAARGMSPRHYYRREE
jgi:AraC-like DNA-binding protein